MNLRLTAAPAIEPVSLDELKAHLRVDGDDENDLLAAYGAAARESCETFQGRAYVAQTWKVTLDRFPNGGEEWAAGLDYYAAADKNAPGIVRLPRPPLLQVSGVAYADVNGAAQTLATSGYTVDTESEPGRLYLPYNTSWPTTRTQAGAVTITFVAGYAVPVTADTVTNIFTAAGRTYTANDAVRLTNSGGALPAGLATNTTYYVRDVSGNTFKLAATAGGTAIDVTDAGTGSHFVGAVPEKTRLAIKIMAAHFYENREPVVVGNLVNSVPLSVESLLWQERVF